MARPTKVSLDQCAENPCAACLANVPCDTPLPGGDGATWRASRASSTQDKQLRKAIRRWAAKILDHRSGHYCVKASMDAIHRTSMLCRGTSSDASIVLIVYTCIGGMKPQCVTARRLTDDRRRDDASKLPIWIRGCCPC